MNKKLLAMSVLAAISSQALAFQFDTSDDWQIRWDNTIKGNVMARTEKATHDVTVRADAYFLSRQSDFSVDRSGLGLVSTRVDLLSELDVVWKEKFGFRISGTGWYDPQYKSSNNDHPDNWNANWTTPSADVGDYSHAVKDLHYAGGEFLDAFVFANFDIGDVAIGTRLGRHTIYWGNSLLGAAAAASIGGVMAPLDASKALSVPGSEAKELFMPTNRFSTVVQLTDNLTLNAYYGFEYQNIRLPETGAFFSPAAGLTEGTEFIPFPPYPRSVYEVDGPIIGFHTRKNEGDEGDFGFNVQYYVDAWELEASFIYINYTDKDRHGLHAGFDLGQFGTVLAAQGVEEMQDLMGAWNALCEPHGFDCPNAPRPQGNQGNIVVGEGRWLYKDDIDLFGISLAKEIAGISVGLDLVYRKNTGLPPEIAASLGRMFNAPDWTALGLASGPEIAAGLGLGYMPGDYYNYDSGDYLGAEGDVYSVVLNGLGLLNGEWGLWDGGVYIIEGTFTMLDKCNKNCDSLLDSRVNEDRVVSHIAAVFRPTWYQVLPGWDMTIPMSVAYTVDGEKSPLTSVADEERGNGSIGIEFLVNESWTVNAKYNTYFGPANAGTPGLLKDRDNISMTIKRTF
ncbi:MAG: hypothetical protein DRR04_04500 [Gammaproteobacteria bacterium]|nr:MAG: hypothetical protein DRR04_04500 [Gammaproteobacteria bacterium]